MDSALPQLQKGWQIVRRGKPVDALVFNKNLSLTTKLPQGQVLVKVLAAALNPVGYKMMGMMPNFMVKRPGIAEQDLAGEVVLANGTEFKVGDEVFGIIPADEGMKTGNGSLQEYAPVLAANLVIKPKSMDFIQAAGIALAGLTAYQALMDIGKIEAGQNVFINGGSSSVGSIAIQIAKAKGCKVFTSCSSKNVEYCKELGADEVIDYTTGPIEQQLVQNAPSPHFSVVFDVIGASAALFAWSASYLQPSGQFVSLGPGHVDIWALWDMFQYLVRPVWLGGTNRKFKMFLMTPSKGNLQALADMIADGTLKPQVDSVFSFEDVHKAYDRIMTGRAKGKVVVQLL